MKKNYSLVLLSLLATTTISLAMDAEGLAPEEKKRNRSLLSNPQSLTETGIADDETARGNKKSRPSSDAAFASEDAAAGSGEGGDSRYSQSVLPTVLQRVGVPNSDDQITKEASDVLTVLLGKVSDDTQRDICEILSFARREDISYNDEKPSAAGLKAALSALSTLSEQENYIDTVFGSFLVQNPHLIGLEPSPKDETAGGSGCSSQADDGLELYEEGEDPEATGYGFQGDDRAEAESEEGEDEEDDDDYLGFEDYGSEDGEGSGGDDEDYEDENDLYHLGYGPKEGEESEDDDEWNEDEDSQQSDRDPQSADEDDD